MACQEVLVYHKLTAQEYCFLNAIRCPLDSEGRGDLLSVSGCYYDLGNGNLYHSQMGG